MNLITTASVSALFVLAMLWLARFAPLAAIPLWLLIAVTVVVVLAGGFYAFLAAVAQGLDG